MRSLGKCGAVSRSSVAVTVASGQHGVAESVVARCVVVSLRLLLLSIAPFVIVYILMTRAAQHACQHAGLV